MSNMLHIRLFPKTSILFFLTFIFMFFFSACNNSSKQPDQTTDPSSKQGYGKLVGDEKALDMAENMLAALGGRENWKEVKALNYREKRDLKGLDTTYTLEVWMDLEQFNTKQEQLGNIFHTFMSVGEQGGKIYDLKKERSVEVRPQDMERFSYTFEHDMYRIIKRLALGDELKLKLRNPHHFDVVTPDSVMLGGFNLNEQNLPEYFSSQIYKNGKNESITHYTGWKSVDGLFYPADGETIDRKMTFIMDTWQPLKESISSVFPELDSLKTKK